MVLESLESLERFASDTMGKSYGNFNGGFVGECVSYVQQYMIRCLGISPSGWGNAVDYWTKPNPNFAKHFTRIGADKPMQDGDIIVWQEDARSGVTHYGHIAIAYKGQVLQQNWSGRYVSLNNMFTSGLLGYWRPNNKGGDMPTKSNLDTARQLAYDLLHRDGRDGRPNAMKGEADGDLNKHHANAELTVKYINTQFDSAEAQAGRKAVDAVFADRDNLRRQVSDVSGQLSTTKTALKTEQEKGVGLVKNIGDMTAQLKEARDQLAAFEAEASEPDLAAKAQAEIDRLEAELAAAQKTIADLEAADKPSPILPDQPVAPNNPTPPTETQTPTLSEVLSVIKRWLVSFIKRN